MDKRILEDPIVKELAKSPYKEYNSHSDITDIIDSTSTSGSKGTLQRVKIKKGIRHLEYFKKKFTRFEIPTGETYSALPVQEFIASEIYRLAGCSSPKHKLFLRQRRFKKIYDSRIDSGSKKIKFQELSKKKELEKYLNKSSKKKEFKGLKEVSKLMAAVLVVGDSDRNPRNYFRDPDTSLYGKMDHDRTFERPLNQNYNYAEPDYLVHVHFIEKLCEKQSTTDANHLLDNDYHNLNIVHDTSFSGDGYSKFDDVLFRLNKDKRKANPIEHNEWLYNTNFFDDKTIDNIKKDPIKTFMFVSYIKTLKNLIDMPKEIREQLFDPRNLLKNVWEKLPQETRDDLISHCIEKEPKFTKDEINPLFFDNLFDKRDYFTKYMKAKIIQNYPSKSKWTDENLTDAMNKVILNDAEFYKQFSRIDKFVANNPRMKSIYENTHKSPEEIRVLNRFLLDCKFPMLIEKNKPPLLTRFEENLSQLDVMIELPLQRLKELENELVKNGFPIPNNRVDYGPAVKFIQTAREKNLSLKELKEEIKKEPEPSKTSNHGLFR